MADMAIGKTVSEAMAITEAFQDLMRSRGNTEPGEEMLGEAVVFASVSKYPAEMHVMKSGNPRAIGLCRRRASRPRAPQQTTARRAR